MKTKKCNEEIIFRSGNDDITFHCMLDKDHTGRHREFGMTGNKKYSMFWREENVVIRNGN